MIRTLIGAAVAAGAAAIPLAGAAQDSGFPFEIRTAEPSNAQREVAATPTAVIPPQLDLRYAAERPDQRLSGAIWRDGATVRVVASANYAAFLDRVEVVFADAAGMSVGATAIPIGRVAPLPVPDGAATWRLEAVAANGRRDIGVARSLDGAPTGLPNAGDLLALAGRDDLIRRRIRVAGRGVVADGAAVQTGQVVMFGDVRVPVRADGRFEETQIVPVGDRVLVLDVRDGDGRPVARYSQPVTVVDEDEFFVGIADLTLFDGDLSSADPDAPADASNLDGRLAFYLRTRRGNWDITASADTRERPVEDLFDNFLDRDPRAFLRRLDPDLLYPTYGDDSTAVNDAPTDGNLFVLAENGPASLLVGNFRLATPSNRFVRVDRALFGARARWESARVAAEVFGADPGTVTGRDTLLGTGGSIYYLREDDILPGSAEIAIEIRDAETGVLRDRRVLTPLLDYEVNAIQGRVTLRRPLTATADPDGLVRQNGLSGDQQFLVVSYEFTPGLTDPDAVVFGGSAEIAATERLSFGLSGLSQETDGDAQRLFGLSTEYRLGAASALRFDVSRSENDGPVSARSLDGGFTFEDRTSGEADGAQAARLGLNLRLEDLSLAVEGNVEAYVQGRQAGFSGPGEETAEDILQYGVAFTVKPSDRAALRFEVEGIEAETLATHAAEVDLSYDLSDRWRASVGLRHDVVERDGIDDGRRTDGVLRLDYRATAGWTAYGFAQATLAREGTAPDNDRVGIGGSADFSRRLTFSGEVSTGSTGPAALAAFSYAVDDDRRYYAGYELAAQTEAEGLDASGLGGGAGRFTHGGSHRLTESAVLLAEQSFLLEDGERGVVDAFTVDVAPEGAWSYAFGVERGDLEVDGTAIDRRALSATAAYSRERTTLSARLEWKKDETGGLDRETWGAVGNLRYMVSEDWRAIGRLYATRSDATELRDSDLIELIVGAAYRPVANDRLNGLFRYIYLDDDGTPARDETAGLGTTVSQRSHVLSVDAIYELTDRVEVGGKVGFRRAEVRVDGGGDWVRSDSLLSVARIDWRATPHWDLHAEVRHLDTQDAESSETGGLAAIYRRFENGVRVGLGYSSTSFNDDLNDLDRNSRGLFFNVVGVF